MLQSPILNERFKPKDPGSVPKQSRRWLLIPQRSRQPYLLHIAQVKFDRRTRPGLTVAHFDLPNLPFRTDLLQLRGIELFQQVTFGIIGIGVEDAGALNIYP